MRKPTRTSRRPRPTAALDEVDGDDGETLRRREEEGNGRPHRRSGAHVPARDGRGRIAQPRGRDRHRQAHRGRPRHDDLGPVRKPDHLQRDHRLVERAQRRRDAAARDPRSRGDALQGPDRPSRSRAPRTATTATISEKTAGPSFKEEEEVEEALAEEEDEDEDSLVERRAPRPVEEEDEDNTLCLAQMEETLKPRRSRSSPAITDLYKKFAKLQGARMDAMSAGQEFADGRREEISEAARAAHRRGGERPVPRRQDRISGRPALQLQPPADRARRPDAAPRRAPQGAAPRLPRSLYGPRARRGLGRAGLRHRQEMDRLLRGRRPARSSASAPRSPRSPRRPA